MKLQLPERKKPGKNDSFSSIEEVRHWVADLPLANPDKTRQLLDEALSQINTLILHPQERYEILELLTQPVSCVIHALKRSFLGKPIPLDENPSRKSSQCMAICRHMTTGYEILAEDLEKRNAGNALLNTAIYRSLRFLGEILLTNYQTYVQYPEGLWSEIHTLYALAEKHAIGAQPVTDTSLPSPVTSAIDSLYKRMLLLSLACPYHLRQNEIHIIFDALMNWADASRLTGADDMETRGLFAVNLDADNPPAYRALRDDTHSEDMLRVLDTTELNEQLQALLSRQAAAPADNVGIGDIQTLQRLMLCWGVMPERRFIRKQHDEPIKLVVGLNAVHSITPGATRAAIKNREEKEAAEVLHDPTIDRPTSFNAEPASKSAFEKAMQKKDRDVTRGAYVASSPEAIPMESWKIADMSAGGYCLLRDSEEASHARIGELVAIATRDEQAKHDWHLGVVRWMKFSTERGLELGIQMLSPGAHAIWTSLMDGGDPVGKSLQGILLPGIATINEQESLILPTLPFRTGRTVLLEKDDGREVIKLARQLENTGSFAQYHFTPEEKN